MEEKNHKWTQDMQVILDLRPKMYVAKQGICYVCFERLNFHHLTIRMLVLSPFSAPVCTVTKEMAVN